MRTTRQSFHRLFFSFFLYLWFLIIFPRIYQIFFRIFFSYVTPRIESFFFVLFLMCVSFVRKLFLQYENWIKFISLFSRIERKLGEKLCMWFNGIGCSWVGFHNFASHFIVRVSMHVFNLPIHKKDLAPIHFIQNFFFRYCYCHCALNENGYISVNIFQCA